MKNILLVLIFAILSSCNINKPKEVVGTSLKDGKLFTARTWLHDIDFETGDVITIESRPGGTLWFAISNKNFSSKDTTIDNGKNQFIRFIKVKVIAINDR